MEHDPQARGADSGVLRSVSGHAANRRQSLGRSTHLDVGRRGSSMTEEQQPKQQQNPLRLLPAVERVLNLPAVLVHSARFGRATVTGWVREILAAMRNGHADAWSASAADVEATVIDRLNEVAS